MKYSFLVSLVFFFSGSIVGSEITCDMMIRQIAERNEVRDLPVSWISSEGIDLRRAAALESARKLAGMSYASLIQSLGGRPFHLRLTKLPEGLKLVTIHDESGAQVFDDNEYCGLITCNCGCIKDSPAVTAAKVIRGTDLGDGFKLEMTVSGGHPEGSTSTYAEKKYSTGDSDVVVNYSTSPISPSTNIDFLTLIYKAKKREAPKRYVSARIDFNKGALRSAEIMLIYDLSENEFFGATDQVSFKFGSDGKLLTIMGISQTKKNNPDLDQKIYGVFLKGQNKWFEYNAQDLGAQIIFREIFGHDLSELEGLSLDAVAHIMKAAIDEQILDLNSLLGFKSVK